MKRHSQRSSSPAIPPHARVCGSCDRSSVSLIRSRVDTNISPQLPDAMTRDLFSRCRRWLSFRTYVAATTTSATVLALAAFTSVNARPHFQEIDVERMNIVEPDGKLRLTISDAARSPGWIFHGKVYPGRPKGAGMIFFNDEGEEDGGIGFGGRKVNGKITADGGMAFDRYDSDEAV